MTFINPKTDYAFKKIFGSSDNKGILISFLNAMIYDGNPTIEDLEIINPNLPPKITGLKDTYLDVKARLADGTLVIIEMQVLNVEFFGKRVLYNAAKTYVSQLQKGQ
ncbi:MAG: Rpn family recombination-promoting nuclease/putative transposase, partial [Oscillatoriales cyanobacterium]